MKKINYLLISLIAFFIISCAGATTDISGFKNPDFKGSVKNVLVYAVVPDLKIRQTIENEIINSFNELGYKAVASISIFSPAKNYTNEELLETIMKNNIDGVLIISITDFQTSKTYIPQTTIKETKGKGNVIGDYLHYKSTTTIRTYGGYEINKPIVSFESALFNVEDGLQIWVSNSITKGNGWAKINTLASSLGGKIIENLIEQRIIKK